MKKWNLRILLTLKNRDCSIKQKVRNTWRRYQILLPDKWHSILLFSFIFLHWSQRKAFLTLLAILWNSTFKWVYLSFSPLPFTSLLFSAICKPPQTTILPFCIPFSWGWSWSLPPVQCHEPLFIVLQALYQVPLQVL